MLLFKNGKFFRVDKDLNVDLEKTMEMNLRDVILKYSPIYGFTYQNTLPIIKDLVNITMQTVKDCEEEINES